MLATSRKIYSSALKGNPVCSALKEATTRPMDIIKHYRPVGVGIDRLVDLCDGAGYLGVSAINSSVGQHEDDHQR